MSKTYRNPYAKKESLAVKVRKTAQFEKKMAKESKIILDKEPKEILRLRVSCGVEPA